MSSKRTWAMRCAITTALATALTGAIAASPAAAHKSDDWVPGYDFLGYSYAPSSAVAGSAVFSVLTWSDDGRHSYKVTVKDTEKDGRSAVAQIQYQVFDGFAWHTHRRFVGRVTLGAGAQRYVQAISRNAIRDLHIRACTMNEGKVVQCDKEFR